MQAFNEFCLWIVSVLYISLSDFNPDVHSKIKCGWAIISIMLINIIFPNLIYIGKGIKPDVIRLFSKKPKRVRRRAAFNLKKLENARKVFINKNMVIKDEFAERKVKLDDFIAPKKNQVMAVEKFPEVNVDFYKSRKERIKDEREMAHYSFELDGKEVREKQVSVIDEQPSLEQSKNSDDKEFEGNSKKREYLSAMLAF